MSPVLPIDTQRYESVDYTLEITAHQSSLSQWSDRPVVRQLRFSLWSNQPTRQRLVAGDQQQLITLSDRVETYVQRHLTHAAWPRTHRFQLLDQDVELSTLQLFNLAEVLNACGQRQITLPTATVKSSQRRKQRRRWLTGSAAASLLAAMGVATAYLQYRPDAFNQLETAQAPEVIFEAEIDADIAPPAQPEASSANGAESEDIPDVSEEEAALESRGGQRNDRVEPLAERPTLPPQQTTKPAAENDTAAVSEGTDADVAEQPSPAVDAPLPTEAISSPPTDEQLAVEPAPAPAAASRAPRKIITPPGEISGIRGGGPGPDALPADEETLEADDADDALADVSTLAAIATQLAPYQPTGGSYPLVYRLHIAPDGTISAIEPMGSAPAIAPPSINPAPGRPLSIELIYRGANPPVVNELFDSSE